MIQNYYTEKVYKKGSIIWMENSKAIPRFYLVKSGTLKQYLRLIQDEDILYYRKGDTFNLTGCFTNHYYLNRLTAIEDSLVLEIERDDLIPFLSSQPKIFFKIVSDYSNKLRNINQKLISLCSGLLYQNDPAQFLQMAAYFENNRLFPQQIYALEKFLEYGGEEAGKTAVIEQIKSIREKEKPGAMTPAISGKYVIYKKGDIIFLEHEKGDQFYFIEEGKVKISHIDARNEYIIALLREKEFFGEMAILNQNLRNATAIAFEDSRLLVLNKENLIKDTGIKILQSIFTSFAKRIWYSYRKAINLSYSNPNTRLYDSLEFILESKGIKRNLQQYTFDIKLQEIRIITQTNELSDNEIREFLEDDNLSINYGTIVIRNLDQFYNTVSIFVNRERDMQ